MLINSIYYNNCIFFLIDDRSPRSRHGYQSRYHSRYSHSNRDRDRDRHRSDERRPSDRRRSDTKPSTSDKDDEHKNKTQTVSISVLPLCIRIVMTYKISLLCFVSLQNTPHVTNFLFY